MNSTEYVISSDPNWLSGISKSHRYSLNLRPTKNDIGNQVFLLQKIEFLETLSCGSLIIVIGHTKVPL